MLPLLRVFSLLMLLPISITAQSIEYYTDVRVGDKVGMYFSEKPQVLLFADELTCWTCTQAVTSMTPLFAREDIRVVLFKRGSKQVDEYDTLPALVTVVEDRVGAYHQYYKVKHSGLLVLLDETGRIIYSGVPGKSSFKKEEFYAAIEKLHRSRLETKALEKKSGQGEIVKEIPLELSVTFAPSVDYLEGQGMIAVLSQKNLLTVTDTLGNTVRRTQLSGRKVGEHSVSTPVLGGERVHGGKNVVVIADADPTTLDPITYGYDVLTDSLFLLSVLKYHPGENQYVSWLNSFSHVGIDRTIGRIYSLLDQDIDTLKPLFMYHSSATDVRRFGSLDSFYVKSYLVNYGNVAYGLNAVKDVLAVYMLGRNMYVYDTLGTFKRCIVLAYDSTLWDYTWLEKAATFRASTPLEYKMALQKQVTMTIDSRLLIDIDNDDTYIPLLHARDGIDGALSVDYYVHRVTTTGVQKTYSLPPKSRPVYVNKRVVCCLAEKGSTYSLLFVKL
jgi:hypothetical protein